MLNSLISIDLVNAINLEIITISELRSLMVSKKVGLNNLVSLCPQCLLSPLTTLRVDLKSSECNYLKSGSFGENWKAIFAGDLVAVVEIKSMPTVKCKVEAFKETNWSIVKTKTNLSSYTELLNDEYKVILLRR